MTFQCWVFRRWVFEAYYREYPTRNLELGIPDVGYSRRWVFQMLGIPYENHVHRADAENFRVLCDRFPAHDTPGYEEPKFNCKKYIYGIYA